MATKSKATKKTKPKQRVNRSWSYALISIGLMIALLAVGYYATNKQGTATSPDGPVSRQVIMYQESIIKTTKPAPTLAALQYAYLASAYKDGLDAGGQQGALQAASTMLQTLYPDQKESIVQHIESLTASNHIIQRASSSDAVLKVITKYQQRYAHDGHDLAWDGVIPTGTGKWIKVTPKDPFTPRAGDWQRWNVSQAIVVPPPPAYGSAEDLRQIGIVQQAVDSRNGQDINTINFWGGAPGTETPAGIWQNQLYKTVQPDLSSKALAADEQYAVLQEDVAQTISDAFMECWKVKYTYWTARPSMRITGLVTAMNDPNFPSYISGHSTISKAAADVLSVIAPKYHDQWESMAMEARQSRLKAGIHFEVDNAVGFDVGTAVADQTVTNLHLQKVLN